MNGWEKHNIKHTSASALNLWADCPGAWVARYLFNKKFSFGVAPQIGMLVEELVAQVLTKERTFEKALNHAHKKFNKDNALNTNVKDRERIKDIETMAALALNELAKYGTPDFDNCVVNGRKQEKIELLCKGEGWELPVIGFLDFVYKSEGVIIDLKTTLRIPSTMSEPHKRQGAIYSKAKDNHQVKFLYVSPKKAVFHDIDNVGDTLQEVKNILNRQERMLAAHDAESLRKIVPVNRASFMWNGQQAQNILKELYDN